MTITEALAELKTIQKRIEKKRQFVREHLGRADCVRDPLEKDGGSVETVKKEMQAIRDLEERTITLRVAIHKANIATAVTVGEATRTIQEWLTWRREVSGGQKQFMDGLASHIHQTREQARQKGVQVVPQGQAAANPTDIILHLSEIELQKGREGMETILGELDGKLSLKNATTELAVV